MAKTTFFVLQILWILVFTTHPAYSACPSGTFRCRNFDVDICVDISSVGDGQTDCPDNTDEDDKYCGPSGQNSSFVCDGTCTQLKFRWDDFKHCNKGEDEVKYIGDGCPYSPDGANYPCNSYVTYATCVTNICKCQTGWREIDFKTCQRRVLGDPCGVDIDCSSVITHSQCHTFNDTCQCVDGAYRDSGNCTLRKIGDMCAVDRDCSAAVADSFCSQSGGGGGSPECLCVSGYLANAANKTCTLRKLGDACSIDSDCADAVPLSNCTGNTCDCHRLYLPLSDNVTCATRNLSDTCDTTDQCTEGVGNTTCTGNQCVCSNGWYRDVNNAGCIARRIGENCTANTDCSGSMLNSSCASGLCTCDDGYFPTDDNSSCLPFKVGDNCTTIANCKVVTDGSCINLTCSCFTGWQPAADLLSCVKNVIGSSCAADNECSAVMPNSVCIGGKCQCEAGYHVLANNVGCRLPRLDVDTCGSNSECPAANSYCKNGKCSCQSEYKSAADNQTCILKKKLGDSCSSNLQCADVANAECVGGRCTCIAGYNGNTAKTLCSPRVIGSDCTSDAACLEAVNNSICNTTTKKCECITNYVSILGGTHCQQLNPYIKIGDACNVNLECNHRIANSTCSGGKCTCVTRFYASSSTTCSPGCSKDTACQSVITNSKCINTKCACEAGTRKVVSSNTCVKNNLGDLCNKTSDCALIGNATCQGGICVCADGYYEMGTQCVCFKLGDKCTKPADCTAVMPGSNCTSNGICECVIGHWPLSDFSGCSKYKLGDNCTSSPNCGAGVSGSGCVAGKCQCLTMYDTSSGQCIPKKLFSSCAKDSDCPASLNSKCQNGICVCKTGYLPDASNTTCYITHLGGNCMHSSDCTKFVNNSICAANGTCVCIDNYRQSPGQDICIKKPPEPECDFFCQYPWLIPVACVVGMILIIVGIVILYFVCKIKKKKTKPKPQPKEKGKAHLVYAMRPPSPLGTLYDIPEGKEPDDNVNIMEDQFYPGLDCFDDDYIMSSEASRRYNAFSPVE